MGIIGLFISLVYALAVIVAGFSASLSTGQRWLLIVFVVAFPFVMLYVFQDLVKHYHTNLYSPKDYERPEDFVKVASRSNIERRRLVEANEMKFALSDERDIVEAMEHHSPDLDEYLQIAREAEHLALKKLEGEIGDIRRDIVITDAEIYFDGFASYPLAWGIAAIEVRAVRSLSQVDWAIGRFDVRAKITEERIHDYYPFIVYPWLVFVTIEDLAPQEVLQRATDIAARLRSDDEIAIQIRVYSIEELRKEFSLSS